MLHQGDLLKKFKENKLAKVNFLKLLTKENPSNVFISLQLSNNDVEFIEISSKKVRANKVDYSTIKITSKKVSRNTVDISTKEITSKKVRENKVDFSTMEITPKKVGGNNVGFSTIEITSKKVRGNNVDFLTIEITSKKDVETTWKFVEIWSLANRYNILVWCARWVTF